MNYLYDPDTDIVSKTPVQAAAAVILIAITFPLVDVDFVPKVQAQLLVDEDFVPLT